MSFLSRKGDIMTIQNNLKTALLNLGLSVEDVNNIEIGNIQVSAANREDDMKAYVAGGFFSGDNISFNDYDDAVNGNAKLSLWEPFEDYPVSWIADEMKTSLRGLRAFVKPKFTALKGFYFKGSLILDPTLDEDQKGTVVPELYYEDSYNDFMIKSHEERFNEILVPSNHKVSIYQTEDYYGEGSDEIDESDKHFDKPMFEARIENNNGDEVEDTTTGRWCSLQSVVDDLEGFVTEFMDNFQVTTYFDDTEYEYDENITSEELDNESQLGMLESYGSDYDQVEAIVACAYKHLWSVVDCEDDKVHVVAGMADKDAIYYIITKQEWESENEDYLLGGDNGDENE